MAKDKSRAGAPRRGAVRWSKDREDRFIEMLERHCNVSRAAAEIGANPRGLYRRRQTDPEFARRWREAIDASFDDLRLRMLARVRDGWTRTETRIDPDTGKSLAVRTVHDMRPGPAVALLRLRQEEVIAMRRIEAEERAARAGEAPEAQGTQVRAFMDEIRARLRDTADDAAGEEADRDEAGREEADREEADRGESSRAESARAAGGGDETGGQAADGQAAGGQAAGGDDDGPARR